MTIAAAIQTDWRQHWFEIEDAIYFNAAGQAPMPKAALQAVQNALEWKKYPHRMPDHAYFEVPNQIRESIAKLIGAKKEEIALTTGASTGAAAVAYGLEWRTGDEILVADGEFPLQYSTWKPMEDRDGVKVRVAAQRERWMSADDFIAALTPRTKLVSVSLVRFDDGSLLDAAKLSAACHAQGALLLLDASQSCGAIPLNVASLGADFVVASGYKWLLSPYGTGFFWIRGELISKMRPGPFYWQAVEGANHFGSLVFPQPKAEVGAKRWDSAETASYFNLAGMNASLEFVLQVGPETIARHNHKLIDLLYSRLPKDRCVPTSPLRAAERGPYGCFAARTPEKTKELYARLRAENVIVSLREGHLRVSPHLYNTERDIDRLIAIITS
ncbi:MAG TPA: aminotransferase class V-fold PLP-dependent enzyme [Candidatus Dormibacteraeota bacterium]|nr:aminotransferase class V-fold PLP-dependent enzyme [Candidatus Dormibacteraeota bacterium]